MPRAGNCTWYQDCDLQGLPFKDLLSALIVIDANGCYHVNTVVTTENCNTLTSALACATGESFEDLFRKAVVLDDCGLPALAIFSSSLQ